LIKEVLLVGPDATEELGESMGRQLRAGQAVGLRGELGAGKTCLVRGLARGLWVDEPEDVCSPTYLLVMEHPGPLPLLHVDAYLPGKTRSFLEEGGLDYLLQSGGVVVVEWAERIAELLPAETLWVDLLRSTRAGRDARRALFHVSDAFSWCVDLPARLGP